MPQYQFSLESRESVRILFALTRSMLDERATAADQAELEFLVRKMTRQMAAQRLSSKLSSPKGRVGVTVEQPKDT